MEAARVHVSARAKAWRRTSLQEVCDVLEPWEYGTVARASRHPSYFDFNLVAVEREPSMDVDGLNAFVDRALDGLQHRRIEFECYESGEAVRAEFEARGWRTTCLLWMLHEGARSIDEAAEVSELPYDAVHALRVKWHQEDFPGLDASSYFGHAREVALARNPRILAVLDERDPVAYAQIESRGDTAEITDLYVDPYHRGQGLGTALTQAAIVAASPSSDLWITADDEGRPKRLYARLGFQPAWRVMQFLRLP